MTTRERFNPAQDVVNGTAGPDVAPLGYTAPGC